MADEKKYVSIFNNGSQAIYVKDSEARLEIDNIKNNITSAMHYVGVTTSVITDGSIINPIVIDENNYTAKLGDVVIYETKEYIFNGTKWSEFGSTGSLKALAFKDSASGSVTTSGTNSPSAVTLSGGNSSRLVTTVITPIDGTETVSKVTKTKGKLETTSITGTNGTETVSKITNTDSSKLVTTSITGVNGSDTVHDTPTLNKTSITPVGGTIVVHDTPTLNKTTVKTVDNFTTGSLPSMVYNEATETITFNSGSLPGLTTLDSSVGTSISAGTEKTVATAGTAILVGTSLSAGTQKTFAIANDNATIVATGAVDSSGQGSSIVTGIMAQDKTVAKVGTATTVATGSVAANGEGVELVTEVTISDKTVAKASSNNITVATGNIDSTGTGSTVVTELPTGGTAAAQVFTGDTSIITVS